MRRRKNKKPLFIFIVLVGVVLLAFSGYKIFEGVTKTDGTKFIAEEEQLEESTEVVNDPTDSSILQLSNQTDGHDFIHTYHVFYNDTICFGKLETAKYEQQKEAADEILAILSNASTKNEDLATDLAEIEKYATRISEQDDRNAMKKLHRLFHDLDIYFNGYSRNTAFNVTEFIGE